jgi:phage FluMu protein gp41
VRAVSGRSVSRERESATLLVSPGIHSLTSRDLARISIFASFLEPLKFAKHV